MRLRGVSMASVLTKDEVAMAFPYFVASLCACARDPSADSTDFLQTNGKTRAISSRERARVCLTFRSKPLKKSSNSDTRQQTEIYRKNRNAQKTPLEIANPLFNSVKRSFSQSVKSL